MYFCPNKTLTYNYSMTITDVVKHENQAKKCSQPLNVQSKLWKAHQSGFVVS